MLKEDQHIPTFVVEGNEQVPLMHTVSFYRRQQNMVGVVVIFYSFTVKKGRVLIRNKMTVCVLGTTYKVRTKRVSYVKTIFVSDLASVTVVDFD